MAQAEVFVAAALRPCWRIWGALLLALREAAFELSDPRPRAIKSAWWADELAGLSQATAVARHPLTQALRISTLGRSLPWPTLARALIEQSSESAQAQLRPVDADAALASVAPLANAIALVEQALFAPEGDPGDAPDDDPTADSSAPRRGASCRADASRIAGDAEAVAVHLLLQRLRTGLGADDAGRVPLNLLARYGVASNALGGIEGRPVLAAWTAELLARLPLLPPASAYRRVAVAHDAHVLEQIAKGRTLALQPGRMAVFGALLRSWRAIRRRPGLR